MYDKNTLKSDLIFWAIQTALLPLLIFLFRNFEPVRFEVPFLFIWYIVLLPVLYISYLEAKEGDAIITGKTVGMGINNSFTGAGFLVLCLSPWNKIAIIHYTIITTCIFFIRFLGRKSRKKLTDLIGKKGVMTTNLHNHGKAIFDDKEYKVYSKEDIFYGSRVIIDSIEANYIYVKKI